MLQLQRISKSTCCIVPCECLFENSFGSVGRLVIEAGLFETCIQAAAGVRCVAVF